MSPRRHAPLAAVLLLAAACGGGGGGGGFAVKGTVSGLQGSGLVLHLAAGARAEDLAVQANGAFAFSARLADGSAYEVTVKTDPTGPSQACAVTGGSAAIAGADANVTVACTTRSFTVGGTVTGLAAGSAVTLRNNGGDDLPVGAAGAFTFATPVASGAAYAVTVWQQPATPPQTCVVGNGAGTVGGGPVTGVTVSCEPNDKPVAGRVDGLLGAGLVLQVNGAFDTPVSAAGDFQILTNLRSGAAWAVAVKAQPTSPWQTCQVTAGGAGVMGPTGAAGVVVTCATDTFAVGGAANGVLVPGLSLALTVNGAKGPAVPVSADGSFTFADEVPSGVAWLVTVESSPSSQACAVASGGGVMGGAAVGDVSVTCGCAPGLGNCNGVAGDGCETSTLTDVAHCGGCGNACAFANAGATCSDGTCQLGACLAGYGDCDASPADGCETDVRSDPSHCGSCLTTCAPLPHAAAACADRSCTLGACAAGWGNCNGAPADGCETDLLTTVAHCGGCNQPCTVQNGVPACAAGRCAVGSCNPGYGDCNGVVDDGCETDVTSSTAHCGTCGTACSYAHAAAACAASTCAMGACETGYSDCNHDPADGCESPASTDPLNCGGCGVVCSTLHGTAACFGAACSMSACDAGWGDCQGSAVPGCETDTRTAHDHCGSCGHACAADQVCAAGGCVAQPSCRAILEANPALFGADGPYTIDPAQTGANVEVWCDMTTDGGGWTFFAHVGGDYQAGLLFQADTGTYRSDRGSHIDPGTGFSVTYGLGESVYRNLGATELMVAARNMDPTLAVGSGLVFYQFPATHLSFTKGPVPCDPTDPALKYRTLLSGAFDDGAFVQCDATEWMTGTLAGEPLLWLSGSFGLGTGVGSAIDAGAAPGDITFNHDSWWYAR